MIAADGTRRSRTIIAETHSPMPESSHPLLQSLRESVFQCCTCSRWRISVLTARK